MANGTPQPNPNQAPQTPDLSFVEPDAIQQIREQQDAALIQAGAEALSGLSIAETFERGTEVRDAARQETSDKFDDQLDTYLSQYVDKANNPDAFQALLGMLKAVSVHRMSSEKWNLGDPDTEGNHTQYETSGRYMVEQMLSQFRGEGAPADNPDVPEAPTPEARTAAQEVLAAARANLAELSIKRRRKARNGGKVGKALEAQYIEAQAQYEQARVAFGAIEAQQWQHDQLEPLAVRKNVITYVLDEHQSFTNEEKRVLTEDPSRANRLAKWFANHKVAFFAASAALGLGAGYGIGKVSKSISKGAVMNTIGLSTAVAAPALALGVLGAKVAKAGLQASVGNRVKQYHTIDKRADHDRTELQSALHQAIDKNMSHEAMVNEGNAHLTNRIDTRVKEDIRTNKAIVIGAAALSGLTGAVGFAIADSHQLHSYWPFDHNNGGSNHGHGANTTNGAGNHNSPNYNDTRPENQNPVSGNTGSGDTGNPGAGNGNGLVDGYNPNVTVEAGNGYQVELQQLAGQKHINLSDAQSWNLYQHLNDKFHGNFLTNDPSYARSAAPSDWGISHAGAAHWNPAVIHEMNNWLAENKVS